MPAAGAIVGLAYSVTIWTAATIWMRFSRRGHGQIMMVIVACKRLIGFWLPLRVKLGVFDCREEAGLPGVLRSLITDVDQTWHRWIQRIINARDSEY